MKILLVSQYFWPESFIINDLVTTLVAQGHKIQVLTGKPNYPEGELFKGYSASDTMSEIYDEVVPVFRIPIRPRLKGGAVNLVLNYLSFVFYGLIYFPKFIKKQNYDVIFVFAPSPITQAIPAIFLKRQLKCHLAIWIQDLWPESLSATGFIRNKWLLNMVRYLVKYIYSKTDTLLIQSRQFFKATAALSDPEKIEYYPNSVLIKDKNISISLPEDLIHTLSKYFCIVFAGNIGKAQSIETIVSAAKSLTHIPDIKFVIVGSGSMLDWLKVQQEKLGLENLMITGRFPIEAMPVIYQQASALLVTLKDEEIFSKTIPSKVQAYLAAGKPILAGLNGEGARVIVEAKAGLSSNAEDVDGLVRNIRSLYETSVESRDEMGKAGYLYFQENFEMKVQAQRLIELLELRIKKTESLK